MKKHGTIFILLAAILAYSQEIIPTIGEIHPEIYRILQAYPPIQKGGYRIERFSDTEYIVLGIGKASLKNGFLKASRTAVLDAEMQIAKAINPTQMTVENHRNKSSKISSSGQTGSQVFREKFVRMLVASHTPFIYSCGVWSKNQTLYCARAVFVGDFEHRNRATTLSSMAEDLKCKGDVKKQIEGFPYLRNGGTVMFHEQGTTYLLTVAIVPGNLSKNQKLTFARNQAYKNMIAFISGGKFEQNLTVLTESSSSYDGEKRSRRIKRKNIESAVKGEFQFIEPQAQWKIDQADCFLYVVKAGSDSF